MVRYASDARHSTVARSLGLILYGALRVQTFTIIATPLYHRADTGLCGVLAFDLSFRIASIAIIICSTSSRNCRICLFLSCTSESCFFFEPCTNQTRESAQHACQRPQVGSETIPLSGSRGLEAPALFFCASLPTPPAWPPSSALRPGHALIAQTVSAEARPR